MKKILVIVLMSVMTFVSAQDTVVSKPFIKPWAKGDFFLGVNSQGIDVSWNTIGLSPLIGWAFSEDDMIYGSVLYTKSPRVSTFKIGYNRMLYKSLYAGVSTSVYGQDSDWPKNISLEAGVYRRLWHWLLVAPKLIVNDTWLDGTNQINLRSEVTFSIKLHK